MAETGRAGPDLTISEETLQQWVMDLAKVAGWHVAHFRPARTARGWRTPVSGDMGKGYPDLTMARPGRFLMVELKSEKGRVSPEQKWVHETLRAAGVDVRLWRPSDWDEIEMTLVPARA